MEGLTRCVPILSGAHMDARMDELEATVAQLKARVDVLRSMFVLHAAVQTVAGDCEISTRTMCGPDERTALYSNAVLLPTKQGVE